MKNTILCLAVMFAISTSANNDLISTIEDPKPLIGMVEKLPIKIFMFDNYSFTIDFGSGVIVNGNWSQTSETVTFGTDGIFNRVAFANKVFLTKNDKSQVCLQANFYKGPEEYRWRSDIFCVNGESIIPLINS